MLNEKDLQLFEYNDSLKSFLQSIPRYEIIEVVQLWFTIPELRPTRPDATFDAYLIDERNKSKILERVTILDWPRGLYACQIAQLHAQRVTGGTKKTQSRVIQMCNDKEDVKLHLELDVIQNNMELDLSTFFTSYIYSFHHEETDTLIFIMSIGPKDMIDHDYSAMSFSFMIYFPGTEYVVAPRCVWGREKDDHFKESLLSTFNATSLTIERIDITSLDELIKSVDVVKSQGILGQLRNNELDKTPLDIRQKKRKGLEQSYVDVGEQRKRIVPIDMEEMKARYEALNGNFGWDEVDGLTSLEVNLELPLNSGRDNSLLDYEDDIVEISMVIEGTNIAEGVRKSIISGKIRTPAPIWLEAIAVTGVNKITVNSEGVVEEKDEEVIPKETPVETTT